MANIHEEKQLMSDLIGRVAWQVYESKIDELIQSLELSIWTITPSNNNAVQLQCNIRARNMLLLCKNIPYDIINDNLEEVNEKMAKRVQDLEE